jgi:hypothetical protein
VAKGVGPEFKSQYHKKKERKRSGGSQFEASPGKQFRDPISANKLGKLIHVCIAASWKA